jgi:hypothetical protein
MSTAQNIEWLNLVEKTGPFLAVGVLDEAFPQGLEKVETRRRQRVRSAYDEWRDAVDDGDPQLDGLHREWVRLVLEELLEYEPSVLKPTAELPATLTYLEPLTGAEVMPDFAVLSGDKARLLITRYAPDTDLSAPLAGETWAASPIERMTTLCRATGVHVGLITDGEQWTLVSVPADGGSSLGTWYARIWQQETVTLQAFVSLLEVRRCFGPAEVNLDSLFLRSLEHQDEVTDTLGEQVRRAVEVLVQALDRADLDRDRELLKDMSPAQLYEAGLTVMMRLVVLLCAEERKLLLLGEPIYDQHYAVSTLRARLLKDKERLGEEVLERRHDAWSRLLAVFRAVFGGIEHETLRLPPLGGSLFDPDRFPFLEGRASGTSWREVPAVPLPIDNRTVLMLLTALQVLEQRSGALLLSYEALDVEQIGHVYEGLLERTVKRVPETTLGLVGSQKAVNPTVALRELEEMQGEGDDELLAFLLEKTGRSEPALRNALARPVDEDLYHGILLASGSDIPLADRIKPFGLLLRTDSWGDPLAYREDAFIVTLGAGRRETGTHYTPKSLTEPIVQHALEPLAYVGPAEGKPRAEWRLKSPAQLLALKVCDMAMGSGAFLVQTCRWLGERLVEAWDAEEKAGRAISIEGVVLDQPGDAELLPRDRAERVLIARRLIASRCLYGVDINPMAVELAKLSLWLITMMRNRPFSFLDHALKCGDSLLGVSEFKQLEHFSIRDPDHAQPLLETANLWRHIEQAAALRRELEAMPSHTAAQIKEKTRLHTEAETLLARLHAAADFLVAAELDCPDDRGWDTRRAVAASRMQSAWKQDTSEMQRLARIELNARRPFHWPLEFPEVFETRENGERLAGFDLFVGNPPFMGGKKLTGELGTDYRNNLVKRLARGKTGVADLCAYFVLRLDELLSPSGAFGLIATDTIAQGDTREVGLDQIAASITLYRVAPSQPWPGTANVVVSLLWGTHAEWRGKYLVDNKETTGITPFLTAPEDVSDRPHRLAANLGKSFIGSQVHGEGFIVDEQLVHELIAKHPKNRSVLFPYHNGRDLNTNPDQSPSRWVINFFDWPLSKDESPADYDGPVASDFPDVLSIVLKKVKPERDHYKRKSYRERWWRYAEPCMALYRAIHGQRRVLVKALVSPTWAFSYVSAEMVYDQKLVVLVDRPFAILQSSHHYIWTLAFGATMGATTLTYTPTDCCETFPFPNDVMNLESIGEDYHELRRGLMKTRQEGLTKTYNRFHNPDETAEDIIELRELHRQLDAAVAAAYGWTDFAANDGTALRHDFHETKQGVRWTLHPDVRRNILDRLLALNHQRHAEEVADGLHDKKGGKKKPAVARPQEPELAFEPTKPVPAPARGKAKDNDSEPGRSSSDVEQTELLNAIFTCAARREVTDREDLAHQVAETLGFQRLTANLREVIASGINSAIRRGLVTYDAQNIHRVAASYAELDHEFLVKAINASIRPGCVYTPEEVLYLAADYLGCKRLKDAFRDCLESALNAASRRGIITNRSGEIRKPR